MSLSPFSNIYYLTQIKLKEIRWHLDGTLAPLGTVFSKYLLEIDFRSTFEIWVPPGAKVSAL